MLDSKSLNKLKKDWDTNGFVILKNSVSKQQIEILLKNTRRLSNLTDDDYQDVIEGKKNHYVNTNQPFIKNKEFWSLVNHEPILNVLRTIIGENICYYGADSITVHRSATTLHRDSFIDTDNLTGPDFDPNLDELSMVKAAMYLVPNEFIVVPGSHKKSYPERDRTIFKEFADIALMVELNPQDIILFNPMLIHAGRYLTKPKYMLGWCYAARNRHTIIGKYYSQIVTSLAINPYDKNFKLFLETNKLYWGELYNDKKYIPYFENIWKNMPKHSDIYAKKYLEGVSQRHWSPYQCNLY